MIEKSKTSVASGMAAILGASILWGFNYIPTKIAVGEIHPLALLLIRLLVTIPLFSLMLFFQKHPLRPVFSFWRRGIVLALLAVTGDQLLYLYSLKYTTPAHGALMYVLVPIFVAIFATIFIKEKIGLVRLLGILLAFVGAVILASEDGLTFESRFLLGDVMMLGAALCWSLYVVLSKPVVERIGSTGTLTLVFSLGLPLALPFTILPALNQPWDQVTSLGFYSAAYLVLGGTFGAYLCYQSALKHLPASLAAPFAYTQPVLAAAFSVILLRETLSTAFYISAGLILLGLAVATERIRSPKSEA